MFRLKKCRGTAVFSYILSLAFALLVVTLLADVVFPSLLADVMAQLDQLRFEVSSV